MIFYSNHFVRVSSSVMLRDLTIVRLWQNRSVFCIPNFSCDNFVLECNNCAVGYGEIESAGLRVRH